MTDERMALLDLVEKRADVDLARTMLAFAAERIMDAEVKRLTGAARGARARLRETHRNGYRDSDWGARAGRIEPAIPKLRKGSCLPNFLEPRRGEAARRRHPGGLRPRRLDARGDGLVKAMGAGGMSKGRVSRLCAGIGLRVNAVLSWPPEGVWPCLWLDATCLKVRDVVRTLSRAAIVAVAVRRGGKREDPGVAAGLSEAEAFRTDFLRRLADRGVRLAIADDHKGLRAAARRVFQTTHQRRHVGLMRDALVHAPTKQRSGVAAMLRSTFARGRPQARPSLSGTSSPTRSARSGRSSAG